MSNVKLEDGGRASLVFVPDQLGAEGQVDGDTPGHYELVKQSYGRYAYVPPAPPGHLGRLLPRLVPKTLFSIITPVYNTPPALLRAMVESVQAQWYPHWELILIDDKSTLDTTRASLARITDPRIELIRLDNNQGISGATNVGIHRAVGDFIVFLDHDDELTPDCLYELAVRIARDQPDYVYSDEDKIAPDGNFVEPFFKPDWSPDAMMSTMITCHVSCVRRTLAVEIGGLRSEYDGSQDWDFVLRLSERTARISHIPKVLYHWRVISASVASDLMAKPYAVDAAKRAREDALRRRGLTGNLLPVEGHPGCYAVEYALRGNPLISIIIPSKNNGPMLRACVDSIVGTTDYPNFEVIIVDNGSDERGTLDCLTMLATYDRVSIIPHAVPFNYSEINNFGVRHARGEILLFLNDDTEVLSGGWLKHMGGFAQLTHVGAVGAKLIYPGTHKMQHAGVVNLPEGPGHALHMQDMASPGYFTRNLHEHNWLAVTGACLMVERRKFEMAGGFDEDLPIAYNDVALCFSLAEHGLYQVVCPGVHLIHHESMSRGDDRLDEKKRERLESDKRVLYAKHPTFFMRDPFYNPNFESETGNFEIR